MLTPAKIKSQSKKEKKCLVYYKNYENTIQQYFINDATYICGLIIKRKIALFEEKEKEKKNFYGVLGEEFSGFRHCAENKIICVFHIEFVNFKPQNYHI